MFYGSAFHVQLLSASKVGADKTVQEATVFAYAVRDPERDGVVAFNENGNAISIDKKPMQPNSRWP